MDTEATFLMKMTWTALGFVGAGISIGARISRGEDINKYGIITTLVAGAAAGGTCTEALIDFANLEPFLAGAVALFMGLMAMGFVMNAIDGKIPFINNLIGKVGNGKRTKK